MIAERSNPRQPRIFHADDGAPFVGARIRLGGTHVFTDESGTYRFISPPVLGDQVLLIDGNTNNTAQFEFPSGIAMPVMIVAGQDIDQVGLTALGALVALLLFSPVALGLCIAAGWIGKRWRPV